MKKEKEKENGASKKHFRHEYKILPCVEQGFLKRKGKTEEADDKTLYTTLYCSVCGETKEVVAVSNMASTINNEDEDMENIPEEADIEEEDDEEETKEAV